MTVTALKSTLSKVLSDHRLDVREARELVAATGSFLAADEAKLLGALATRFTRTSPGSSSAPYATAGARDTFDALFREHHLAFGGNRAKLTQELATYFSSRDLGQPLAKGPSTSSLVPVVIRDDRARDGFRQTAHIHPESGKTYLYVDGGGRGNPTPRWYGPFDRSAPAPAQILPMPAGMITNRRVQLVHSANEAANASARGSPGSAPFALESLPAGARVIDTGIRIQRGSGTYGRTLSVLLVDDGRGVNALDKYYLRAEGGSTVTRFAGPITLPPLVDPMTDGKLTYPDRAKNLCYKLAREERLNFQSGAPPSSVKLARGWKIMGDFSPYFVIPRKADGTLDDPDRAKQVYFYHAPSKQWSGPHDL